MNAGLLDKAGLIETLRTLADAHAEPLLHAARSFVEEYFPERVKAKSLIYQAPKLTMVDQESDCENDMTAVLDVHRRTVTFTVFIFGEWSKCCYLIDDPKTWGRLVLHKRIDAMRAFDPKI